MTELAVPTKLARAGQHEHLWRGRGVFATLVGKESLLGLVMLGVCGRAPTDEERALLDELAAVVTVADPRIWPLKIARLVASYGSALAGFAAGQLSVESDAIGPWTAGLAAELLIEVRAACGGDAERPDFDALARELLAGRTSLPGYGVAFRDVDERYEVLRARLDARGRTALPWWRTQARLSEVVRRERAMAPNAAVATAALFLDMGLTPDQGRAMITFAMSHLFFVTAVEGAEQASPILRELPDARVRYAGPAPRVSPRAARR